MPRSISTTEERQVTDRAMPRSRRDERATTRACDAATASISGANPPEVRIATGASASAHDHSDIDLTRIAGQLELGLP